MPVTVTIESPLQHDVRRLVKELNAYLNPLSPPQFQFQMTVEQMAGADTTLFVARDESGSAIGMGALKVHTPKLAEVKRMYTDPSVRRQHVGSAVLDSILAVASERGITRLVLETGTGEGMIPAWRLYERGGFTKCGAVLDYPDSEYSAFFERHFEPRKAVAS